MAALGFDVAAEYFYALGAPLPMAIDADQRYAMATHMRAEQLESRLEDAILGRIIPKPAGMTAAEAAAQIARRLVALGLDGAADSTLPSAGEDFCRCTCAVATVAAVSSTARADGNERALMALTPRMS